MESLKQQSTTAPTEAASELQVLADGNEPAVVHESKDVSLTLKDSDNLSAEVEVEEPAVEDVAIAPAEAKAATQQLKALTSLGLEKRLGRDNSVISRAKKQGNEYFRQWSAKLDPDGIAWEFKKGKPRSAQFHPLV